MLSGDGEKEVARASKLLGPEWVMQIKKRYGRKPTHLTTDSDTQQVHGPRTDVGVGFRRRYGARHGGDVPEVRRL